MALYMIRQPLTRQQGWQTLAVEVVARLILQRPMEALVVLDL